MPPKRKPQQKKSKKKGQLAVDEIEQQRVKTLLDRRNTSTRERELCIKLSHVILPAQLHSMEGDIRDSELPLENR